MMSDSCRKRMTMILIKVVVGDGGEGEEHPKCYQARGSSDDEKLVHVKMVVKFEVLREGVVVISSSQDMLTNNCLGGIMVSLIFLEGLGEEALVEFMVEGGDEDDERREFMI
ncbi:hypothetical protein Tco_0893872 [Tanacetum coccineum]|uniref:Uncharacterized protein n=1 Tax=Tanacetum coccineum TaxID=301880 RepID=A0ABQ5CA30_9ASTR